MLYSLLAGWGAGEAAAGRQTCLGRQATIVGTPGDDRIRGTTNKDIVVAGGSDDVVRSRGGKDRVCSGKGPATSSMATRGRT